LGLVATGQAWAAKSAFKTPAGMQLLQASEAGIPFKGFSGTFDKKQTWPGILYFKVHPTKLTMTGHIEWTTLKHVSEIEGNVWENQGKLWFKFTSTKPLVQGGVPSGVFYTGGITQASNGLAMNGGYDYQGHKGMLSMVTKRELAGTKSPLLAGNASSAGAAQAQPAATTTSNARPRKVSASYKRTDVPVEGFADFKLWSSFSAVAGKYRRQRGPVSNQRHQNQRHWLTNYNLPLRGKNYPMVLEVITFDDAIAAVFLSFKNPPTTLLDELRSVMKGKYGDETTNFKGDKYSRNWTWIDSQLGNSVKLSQQFAGMAIYIRTYYWSSEWFLAVAPRASPGEKSLF
jgi:hypothetical protein